MSTIASIRLQNEQQAARLAELRAIQQGKPVASATQASGKPVAERLGSLMGCIQDNLAKAPVRAQGFWQRVQIARLEKLNKLNAE